MLDARLGYHCMSVRKCPYSEFFWSVFSCIRTEYENFRSKSLYSVQIRENKDTCPNKCPNKGTFYAVYSYGVKN